MSACCGSSSNAKADPVVAVSTTGTNGFVRAAHFLIALGWPGQRKGERPRAQLIREWLYLFVRQWPMNITLAGLIFLIVIAAVCGAVGRAIAGEVRGGLLVSIVLGFIGAFLGSWIARQMRLPEPFVLRAAGESFPILWSIIGATLFVALIHMISRRRG